MHVNNDFQRNSNISHVFETIWRNKEISRIDISRKLESYRSTISNIIGVLLAKKIVIEGARGIGNEKGGKKPILLSVNKYFGCILGIELQPDFYIVSAVAFDGEPFFYMKAATPFNGSYADNPDRMFLYVIDKIIEYILPTVKDFPMPLLGICFAVPGIVNIDKGIILRSDPFSLKNFFYGEKLKNRYGIPLFIDNDANCCGWLHCSQNSELFQKDFISVLAKSLSGIDKFKISDIYNKGIGIGLSIAINNRILYGAKYGVGEYMSSSWRTSNKGQTGLSEKISTSVNTSNESYRKWIIDLFTTLTITVPLLQPNVIYLHGQPNSKKKMIFKVIQEDVAQFDFILKKFGAKFIFVEENPTEIAQGAALMFIQKLFRLPYMENENSYSSISWDDVFTIHQLAQKGPLIHKWSN